MKYRTLGRTGIQVSEIGLGTEHLDQDKQTMSDVLSIATEAGLTYVDVLYIDPSGDDLTFWQSFGPVLRPYRDRLVLAVHWGGGPRYDLPYCRRTFPEVLKQVGNDYAEVAIMTMIDERDRRGEWMEQSLEDLRRYQEKGHLGYIGGSAHDPKQAKRAVESGLLDVLMFGFNLTTYDQASHQALLQACVDKGVGLVVMKPFSGGTLLNIDGKPTSLTPTQCLSYVLSLPVSTTVPGARNAEQMRAALAYCTASAAERDFGPAVGNMYRDLAGHCVYCNHCLPCPEQIDIASTIMLADWATGGLSDELRAWYDDLPVKASACVECGDCEERCPFGVEVIAKMRKAAERFEKQAV